MNKYFRSNYFWAEKGWFFIASDHALNWLWSIHLNFLTKCTKLTEQKNIIEVIIKKK